MKSIVKKKNGRKRSVGEITLEFQLNASKIPFRAEFRFHATRKWEADFGFPAARLLVEIEGGIYIQGRHQRPGGFIKDMEKYNTAAMMGYTVLRFSPVQVKKGEAIAEICKFLGIKR